MAICLQIPKKCLNTWMNFSQLLYVHNVISVEQIEIHTAEPLLPLSVF
jgi:hypothetical protein